MKKKEEDIAVLYCTTSESPLLLSPFFTLGLNCAGKPRQSDLMVPHAYSLLCDNDRSSGMDVKKLSK